MPKLPKSIRNVGIGFSLLNLLAMGCSVNDIPTDVVKKIRKDITKQMEWGKPYPRGGVSGNNGHRYGYNVTGHGHEISQSAFVLEVEVYNSDTSRYTLTMDLRTHKITGFTKGYKNN